MTIIPSSTSLWASWIYHIIARVIRTVTGRLTANQTVLLVTLVVPIQLLIYIINGISYKGCQRSADAIKRTIIIIRHILNNNISHLSRSYTSQRNDSVLLSNG